MGDEKADSVLTSSGISNRTDMTAVFNSAQGQFDLNLNDSQLQWEEKVDGQKNKGVLVPLDEIIGLDLTESKQDCAIGDLSLHYIHHTKSSHVLKCKSTIFSAEIAICRQWLQSIQERQRSGFTQPKNLLVFINPISGNSHAEKVYCTQAAPLFTLAGIETDVIITESRHHCTEVLLDYDLSRVDGIVVCGGDGIYSECLNGLIKKNQKEAGVNSDDSETKVEKQVIPIGILPCGTGNAISAGCCGCVDVETSALAIIMGRRRPSSVMSTFSGGNLLAHCGLFLAYGVISDSMYAAETNREYAHRRLELEVSYLPADGTEEPNSTGTMKGNDSTQNQETANSDWITVKGTYINIIQFIATLDQEKDRYAIEKSQSRLPLVLQTPCSKWQFMKYLYKTSKFDESSLDFDFINSYKVKAFKVKVISNERLEENLQKCLDIDGEIVIFNGWEFEVR
ncbi:hypothetical protein ScPMuIL_006392 [Solemya velum]